jgi:hypothetical protein
MAIPIPIIPNSMREKEKGTNSSGNNGRRLSK